MVVFPSFSFAQINIDMPFTLSNELGVKFIPNYPRPNETVFISLTLYTDDLNSADITWYKDGKSVLSGKGETKYSFKAGPVGESAKIEVRIKLLSGTSFSKTFDINPASVDLVWEANTYVPPFYKGKALHSNQGELKIVAMPEFVKNGRRIPSSNLIYKWSNGSEVYQSQSGYGKNILILNGSIFGREDTIDVLVTDPVNNLAAEAYVTVNPIEPQIVFYKNDPYYGHIFDTAIRGSFDLTSEEVQILAAPYFFSKEKDGDLKYEWRLNNSRVTNLENSRTAIFRKPEGQTGQSNISLSIENLNRILQQADTGVLMRFEN